MNYLELKKGTPLIMDGVHLYLIDSLILHLTVYLHLWPTLCRDGKKGPGMEYIKYFPLM